MVASIFGVAVLGEVVALLALAGIVSFNLGFSNWFALASTTFLLVLVAFFYLASLFLEYSRYSDVQGD
jgi:Kef-type K+ transport system membrane component KefB